VPILPGYLPIQNFNSFKKFTSWCKTAVPPHIEEGLEKIKDDDEQVSWGKVGGAGEGTIYHHNCYYDCYHPY